MQNDPSQHPTPVEPDAPSTDAASQVQPPAPESVEAPVEPTAPVAEAEPAAEAPAEPASAEAEQPAPQAAEAPKPARKPPVRKGGKAPSLGAERTRLMAVLHEDYDFKTAEAEGGAISVDLWALGADQKGKPAAEGSKEPWPIRGDVSRPRDFHLLLHFSRVVDPSFGLSGKDLTSTVKDRRAGLLLLLKDDKGYFMTSEKVSDFSNLFPLAADGSLKITGPKLRKAGVARFFSLNGFRGELASAISNAS